MHVLYAKQFRESVANYNEANPRNRTNLFGMISPLSCFPCKLPLERQRIRMIGGEL